MCPKQTGVADFLQEVTSRKDQEVGITQQSFDGCLPARRISSVHNADFKVMPCISNLGTPQHWHGFDQAFVASIRLCLILHMHTQQYWRGDRKWQYVPVEALAEAFKASGVGQELQAALDEPYHETPRAQEALETKPFGLGGEPHCKRHAKVE